MGWFRKIIIKNILKTDFKNLQNDKYNLKINEIENTLMNYDKIVIKPKINDYIEKRKQLNPRNAKYSGTKKYSLWSFIC